MKTFKDILQAIGFNANDKTNEQDLKDKIELMTNEMLMENPGYRENKYGNFGHGKSKEIEIKVGLFLNKFKDLLGECAYSVKARASRLPDIDGVHGRVFMDVEIDFRTKVNPARLDEAMNLLVVPVDINPLVSVPSWPRISDKSTDSSSKIKLTADAGNTPAFYMFNLLGSGVKQVRKEYKERKAAVSEELRNNDVCNDASDLIQQYAGLSKNKPGR